MRICVCCRLRGWARDELPPGALAKATGSPTRAGAGPAAVSGAGAGPSSVATARAPVAAVPPPSLVLGASAVCEHSAPSQLLARLRDLDAHAVASWRERNLGPSAVSAAASLVAHARARSLDTNASNKTSRGGLKRAGADAGASDAAQPQHTSRHDAATVRPHVVFGGPELATSFVRVRPADRDRPPSPQPKFLGLVHSHSLLASAY